jgi:hypothetical protein
MKPARLLDFGARTRLPIDLISAAEYRHLVVTGLGHSRPTVPTPVPANVRFAPLATEMSQLSSDGGTVMSSALKVLRFIITPTFVVYTTGRLGVHQMSNRPRTNVMPTRAARDRCTALPPVCHRANE